MAYIATTNTVSDHRSLIARSFAAIGAFFVAYIDARSRRGAIEALNQLSDAELAERGLTREGIVRYVFADSLYL
jgi:uncharacterized protein YjiS (DUF1127 family)